jgi:hypothetical protein
MQRPMMAESRLIAAPQRKVFWEVQIPSPRLEIRRSSSLGPGASCFTFDTKAFRAFREYGDVVQLSRPLSTIWKGYMLGHLDGLLVRVFHHNYERTRADAKSK